MSNHTLRVTAGNDPRPAIETLLVTAPYTVLTHDCFRDLLSRMGDADAVLQWLLSLANKHQKPIAMNLNTPNGSQTIFLAPTGWTEERLRGYAAMAMPHLEREFGTINSIAGAGPKKVKIRSPKRLVANSGTVSGNYFQFSPIENYRNVCHYLPLARARR